MNDLTRLGVYMLSLTEWDREIMGVVYDSLKLCPLRDLGVPFGDYCKLIKSCCGKNI